MRFDHIELLLAVHEIWPTVDLPRSDEWLSNRQMQDKLIRAIRDRLDIRSASVSDVDLMLKLWKQYGRRKKEDKYHLQLVAEVILSHGPFCFWANRGLGACSEEFDLDRIIPGGPYELANCLIACSKHNRARGNKSIEEYISEGLTNQRPA